MKTRLSLQEILEGVLGSSNVYFQPPENIRMTYPCIVYKLAPDSHRHANNHMYKYETGYNVIFITKSPDPSEVLLRFRDLNYCKFDRHYMAEGLHHFSFSLYY